MQYLLAFTHSFMQNAVPITITIQPWEVGVAITLLLASLGAIVTVVRFLWKLDMSVQNGATALASLARTFDNGIHMLTERAERTDGRIDELWKAFAELLPRKE
jgi:hypothetical protein